MRSRLRAGMPRLALLALLLSAGPPAAAREGESARPDRVLFDFEDGTWRGWTVRGEAFGAAPVSGPVAAQRQQPVQGFLGSFFANSFAGGDRLRGVLESDPFVVDRRFLRLLVGGGREGVGVRLVVGTRAVFEVTGREDETLTWRALDLADLQGQRARLEVHDDTDAGWGHVLFDHAVLTDEVGWPRVTAGVFRRVFDAGEGEARAWYVDGHAFVRGPRGVWHLFGVTHPEPPDPPNEVLLGHATSPAPGREGWKRRPPAFAADPRPEGADEQRIGAPCVVEQGGTWTLFYAAAGGVPARPRIHVATSRDLERWERQPVVPGLGDGAAAGDPYVVRDGDRWLLYTTAPEEPAGGASRIEVRSGSDLVTWGRPRVAFRAPPGPTAAGRCASPRVVRHGDAWYLFVGAPGGTRGTEVYRSRDPLVFHPADRVGHVDAHACEVVVDERGRWFVSHAGWGQGGVWLAPLLWADGAP